MKKLMSLAVAAAFSVSAAAWACDGMKNAAKAEKDKAAKVATDKAKPEKKSDKKS